MGNLAFINYGGRTLLKLESMKKAKKFVYSTVSNNPKTTSRVRNDNGSATSTTGEIKNQGFLQDGMEFGDFDFDDDITSQMTDADLDRLEIEATRKLGLLNNNASVENIEPVNNNMKYNKDANTATYIKQAETREVPYLKTPIVKHEIDSKDSQLRVLAIQLEEYKSKVEELESDIHTKNGELKMLRNSLNEHREENDKKSAKIVQLTNQQNAERSERESSLKKEVESLKTKLGFQEQELKEQSNRLMSQKLSGSVKRKADIPATGSVFNLENSFFGSQLSSSKAPRLERKTEHRKSEKLFLKKELNSSEVQSNTLHTATSKIDKPPEISILNTCNAHFESTGQTSTQSKACYLVKKLVLSHSGDSISDGNQDETISLLALLKYPLKHLPDVLKSHCVDTNYDQSLSQFPVWQTQIHSGSDSDNSGDELDLDEGKYNLASQGIFLLLGLSNQLENNLENLGVIHVLIFLELYISSYCLTRERTKYDKSDVRNMSSEPALHETEEQRASSDVQDMILQTLQILKLLFYSRPNLVKCVLNRTSPAVFTEDVIIIHDSDESKTNKNAAAPSAGLVCIHGCSENCLTQGDHKEEEDETTHVFEDASFRSLLLPNLQKLLVPHSDGSLSVCHAALEVLITITSFCTKTELERIFVPLKSGCLNELLAKDCGISTVSRVISLISNLLPCVDLHTILCSHTDECILLKIYQCVCDDEDDDESDETNKDFLLQVLLIDNDECCHLVMSSDDVYRRTESAQLIVFVQFLKGVALSHNDSVVFLLETDCQCSLEIIRCLVLVLYEKVNYLLDLDIDTVILDESLSILRIGINILVVLCTHSSYTADHKLDVESHYGDLIYKSMMLFKQIKCHIPELDALGLQDLLDMEQIDEIEWSLGSDDDEDDECMVIGT